MGILRSTPLKHMVEDALRPRDVYVTIMKGWELTYVLIVDR